MALKGANGGSIIVELQCGKSAFRTERIAPYMTLTFCDAETGTTVVHISTHHWFERPAQKFLRRLFLMPQEATKMTVEELITANLSRPQASTNSRDNGSAFVTHSRSSQ